MARRVRCQITKEYGTSDTFYKVTTDGKNKYYKSKEIFEEYNRELVAKRNCYDYVAQNIFDGDFVPPVFKKTIGQLSGIYDYNVILETFKQSQGAIDYALTHKNFTNEWGKSKYILKIIENNIYGVSQQAKRIKKASNKPLFEVDLDVLNDANYNTKKKKDISAFLTEEEFND